jgi:hypothetical protein
MDNRTIYQKAVCKLLNYISNRLYLLSVWAEDASSKVSFAAFPYEYRKPHANDALLTLTAKEAFRLLEEKLAFVYDADRSYQSQFDNSGKKTIRIKKPVNQSKVD